MREPKSHDGAPLPDRAGRHAAATAAPSRLLFG